MKVWKYVMESTEKYFQLKNSDVNKIREIVYDSLFFDFRNALKFF